VLIQRGTLGQAQDTDISFGNGPDWVVGAYNASWTGPSPYDHWSLYHFNLSPVPANATVILGIFSNYVSWNTNHSTVRGHVITKSWDESTANWSNFTNNGTITGWAPPVIGSFDPEGVGHRSMDITSTVQAWHSGNVANYGLLLEEDPVYVHNYNTSETGDVSTRPSLYVCYLDASVGEDPTCSAENDSCGSDEECCEGLASIDGKCSIPPGQLDCAPDNAPCGLAPCCNPDATCDGVCIVPVIDPGGGGDACFPVNSECSNDGQCCSSSCIGGICTVPASSDVCVKVDQVDDNGVPVSCSPEAPCCDGASCIWGLCQPNEGIYGGTCSPPGGPCDVENLGQWCCWSQSCIDNTCQ